MQILNRDSFNSPQPLALVIGASLGPSLPLGEGTSQTSNQAVHASETLPPCPLRSSPAPTSLLAPSWPFPLPPLCAASLPLLPPPYSFLPLHWARAVPPRMPCREGQVSAVDMGSLQKPEVGGNAGPHPCFSPLLPTWYVTVESMPPHLKHLSARSTSRPSTTARERWGAPRSVKKASLWANSRTK